MPATRLVCDPGPVVTDRPAIDWGRHPRMIGGTRVFVTPNPGPANAVFSLDELSAWYRQLGVYSAQLDRRP